MQSLPNTEVRNCDHESHGDNAARAVTSIRFAVDGEIKDFWGCLAHRHATDFGYIAPKSDIDQLASAAAKKPETASEDRPSEETSDPADGEPEATSHDVRFESNADADDAIDEGP